MATPAPAARSSGRVHNASRLLAAATLRGRRNRAGPPNGSGPPDSAGPPNGSGRGDPTGPSGRRGFALALGVMTAVGGFVDIGNLVTSTVAGARFGMTLTWAIVLGTGGMVLYGEMAGRIAAVAGRPVFHAVRERLGVRASLVNLAAFEFLAVLTVAAEIGGAAQALQIATGVNYLAWVPIIGLGTWLIVWRMRFSMIENLFGLLGLALLVFVVALVVLPTRWAALWHGATHPWIPPTESRPTYFFAVISLLGACVVPYQVVFFSSGGREERWTAQRLGRMRRNVLLGFPLGGLLSIAIMAAAAVVLPARGLRGNSLPEVILPVSTALGRPGLALALVGIVAATMAAGVEATLASGYGAAQYFGWSWGKRRPPRQEPRFHVVCLVSVLLGTLIMLSTVDPIAVTILSVVLGAAAIPLTYLPVLVVANDRAYLGRHTNPRWLNALSTVFLLVMLATSVATVPLLVLTGAGD